MNANSVSTLVKSRTTLLVAGALVVGAVGAKTFWTDAPRVRVPVATASPKPAPKTGKPSTRPAARPIGSKTTPKTVKSAPEARDEERSSARQTAAAQTPAQAPVAAAAPPARRMLPDDVDGSSDTEGLFVISTLRDAQGAGAAKPPPAVPVTLGDPASNALAERVVTTGQRASSATNGLGAMFVDEANGYCMRFPAGWSIRRFDGQPWVVECGDGGNGLMSVGFSAFPSEYTAESIPLDWVARRTKKRGDTVLNAQGYATIMGRKALWSKSTGPMQIGASQVKVVRTTYILPLGEGRVAEIRIAAAPAQFEKFAVVMKNSVSTFRLLGMKPIDASIARTE